MPRIVFRILATEQQQAEIERDFRGLIEALEDKLDAVLSVRSGLPADPELTVTWVELNGEQDSDAGDGASGEPQGAELEVEVRRYDLGAVSSLAMHFAELLTTREPEPAEALARHVRDDPGTPRVPWHVEVRP